jgi:hypothetical protein
MTIEPTQDALPVYLEALKRIQAYKPDFFEAFGDKDFYLPQGDLFLEIKRSDLIAAKHTFAALADAIDQDNGWFSVEMLLTNDLAQATVNGFTSVRCHHASGTLARAAALADAYAKSLEPQKPILEALEALSGIYNSPESIAHRAAMGLDDELQPLEPEPESELDWRLFVTRARLCDKAYLANDLHQGYPSIENWQASKDAQKNLKDFDLEHPEVLKAIGKP